MHVARLVANYMTVAQTDHTMALPKQASDVAAARWLRRLATLEARRLSKLVTPNNSSKYAVF
jgi:hypothetical protein